MNIRFESVLKKDDLDFVNKGLAEHRFQNQVFQDGKTEFGFFCDGKENQVVAGITGSIFGGWAYIKLLWVDTSLRGSGLGKQLIEKAELYAKEKNAVGIHVNTYSFQAPDFYKNHGYEEFGRLNDHEDGHSRIYLCKKF